MKKSIYKTLILLVILIVTDSCQSYDIVGKWISREDFEFEDEKTSLQTVNYYEFDESGEFLHKGGTVLEDESDDEIEYITEENGEWTLTGDSLTREPEIVKCFGRKLSSDTTIVVRIIKVDNNKMVWESDGKKQEFKKVE